MTSLIHQKLVLRVLLSIGALIKRTRGIYEKVINNYVCKDPI